MGNSLRCCLACVLPCGALDLVRIVHINGQVEEYGRPVTAQEVLEANPDHVISKPCSQGASRKIMIVSPDSELKRGNIYFLIPASALPAEKKRRMRRSLKKRSPKASDATPFKEGDQDTQMEGTPKGRDKGEGHHRRRSSRIAAWKPHLESIHED